jgi:hypothetical protein
MPTAPSSRDDLAPEVAGFLSDQSNSERTGEVLGRTVQLSRTGHRNRPHLSQSTSESKAIPVTGRGGPYGCETSRLPHFLDNRLTDGGEVK